jgi:cytochrome P450
LAAGSLPPGPRGPALLQALRTARDPIRYVVGLRRRYGDMFTVSFPGFGRLVYVAEPGMVKRVFSGDPVQFHAGEANATVLEPALGPNSVLTLDEGAHMRQRKLLMRIVLRTILKRAELRAADPRPEPVRVRNITIAPAHGARVVLERRLPAARPERATLAAAAAP